MDAPQTNATMQIEPDVRSGVHVLLVEDEHISRMSIELSLTDEGYSVSAVGSCEEALASARARRPHIVVTDLSLPDGSGLDLFRTLQELYDVKGIVITGYNNDPDVYREAGFVEWLVKPIDFRLLQITVDRIALELSKGRAGI